MIYKNHACSYFDNIINIKDFDFDNILLDEKSYENILVYDISYKSLIGAKPFRIRFDTFLSAKYEASDMMIYSRRRYLISLESGITYVISDNHAKIKIESYDALPLEKTLTLHNVIILIKPVFNKDQKSYCYNIFLEKCIN